MNNTEYYQSILNAITAFESKDEAQEIKDVRDTIKTLIRNEEFKNRFGVKELHFNSKTYAKCFKYNGYSYIGLWGTDFNRTIAWSDDGRQPENEWLYQISFPTGAYIFGDGYLTDVFNKFFVELKLFNPKYLDSANHNLYYTEENSAAVDAALPTLLEKYQAIAAEAYKLLKIENAKAEIARLQAELK